MRLIIFLTIFLTLFNFNQTTDEIADCSTTKQATLRKLMNYNDLYIVSTLDGKVTALDLNNNGQVLWSYLTNDDGLLQSTIGDFQFISGAIYFKLVPALDGSLYKLNEKYNIIEPLPLTVDVLLKSSYKLGDDLLINGGKEVKTFAFDLITGNLIYSCGLAECTNAKGAQRENNSDLNIILIRQLRQKIKAVDPKSGTEQWKFNVGENNAILLSQTDDCHLFDNLKPSEDRDEKLKISIADGLVGLENSKDNKLLWSQRFDSPIVGLWQYRNGKLNTVDLFSHDTSYLNGSPVVKKPILYIGNHKNQFYIQHSSYIKEKYKEIGKASFSHYSNPYQQFPQIDWHQSDENEPINTVDNNNDLQVVPSPSRALSLPTQGRFLFLKQIQPEAQCRPPTVEEKFINLSLEDYYNETRFPSDSINQIIIISLWHWWKEVLIISVCLAIAINIVITYLRRQFIKKVGPLCSSSRSPSTSISEDDCFFLTTGVKQTTNNSNNSSKETASFPSSTVRPSQSSSNGNPPPESSSNYVSRYTTDFEPICCLGKGGFGVVFEARNKIDDCHYAVKRINLPVQQSAREKVMREVRALASLEHHGIVRYYNSWLEIPPEGWQDDVDISLLPDKSSYWSSSPPSTSAKSESVIPRNSSAPNGFKTLLFDNNNYNNTATEDDSYIVFQKSSGSSNNDESNNQEEEETSISSKVIKSKRIPTKQERSATLPTRSAYLYIQMQLCQKETLREWLKKQKERDKPIILDYFIQIVEAVDYVHSKKLMHRDLKPSNIFFAMDGCIKIGDFGLVTAIAADFFVNQGGDTPIKELPLNDKCHTDQVGTKLYMSPEQISGTNYSNKVDIYSLGVIFFEMLVPFNTEMERIKVLSNIKNGLFPSKFRNQYPKECELVSKLLSNDPDARPLAGEILDDPIILEAAKENNVERIPRKRTISASKAH